MAAVSESEATHEGAPAPDVAKVRRVIVASSVGTLFEWYDFYLYGSLAAFFSELFFPKGNPIAAFLVELFPTRIRYTSMSLPYHVGNGVFGGFTPLIAAALTASTGNPYAGLAYPLRRRRAHLRRRHVLDARAQRREVSQSTASAMISTFAPGSTRPATATRAIEG
jgi:hypothetical protein